MISLHLNGLQSGTTNEMMKIPVTELSRLIAAKWYLSLGRLAKELKMPKRIVMLAIHGTHIAEVSEKKIRRFLEAL